MRRRIEFILDASLLVITLLLLAPRSTGLPIHEWLGIAVAIPIVVHILLSWRWISASTQRVVTRPTPRLRINYFINAILFVVFVLVIGSGIVISRSAGPALGFRTFNDRSWRLLHDQATDFLLVATAFHIAMNWTWVRRTAQRALWTGRRLALRPIGPIAIVRSLVRAAIVLVAAAVVMAVALRYVGRPSVASHFTSGEMRKFGASPVFGAVQLGGEGFFVLAVAYSARKLLRLRV